MRASALAGLGCLLLVLVAGAAPACTSFVMDSPDGPIYGTNCDLFIPGDGLVLVNPRGLAKTGFMEGTTGSVLEWVSEYGSVTFSLAGREFAWGGMNEAGVVISTMQLASGEYPPPDERPPLSDGGVVQYILDTCGTVEEVTRLDEITRVYDPDSPASHYLFADAGGDAGVIEYRDGEFFLYRGETMPVKAMANMPYERSAYAFEHGGTRWWWSNPGRSAERTATAEMRSREFDAAVDTSAVNYAFGTLVHYVAAPHTRWNIVFDVDDGELWYRTDQSPTYKHIALDWFDFACDAPLRMLDVNATFEGDALEHFVPYDRSTNLDVFRTFCGRWGIDVSAEGSAALIEHFDGFQCAESE